jgi:cob(I)alamin adenosyltransferase
MASRKDHKGDDGTTGILGGGRLPKYHPRIEALGTLDEASAALGLARAAAQTERGKSLLVQVQRDIYALMGEVATKPAGTYTSKKMEQSRVTWLEAQIDQLETTNTVVKEFILPGDTTAGAAISLARTIVRRAERRMTELLANKEITNPILLQYLNRLSTLCFSLELFENAQAGKSTTRARQ